MEYLTAKDAANEALTYLLYIEGSIGDNQGISEDVLSQLTKAQAEVGRLYNRLPDNILATNRSEYVLKKSMGG